MFTVNIYEAGDTGPSGHAHVLRGHVRSLLDKDVNVTLRTQQWGWNRKGINIERAYSDSRFKSDIMTRDRLNKDYLIDHKTDLNDRVDDLGENLATNQTARSEDCPIRDFEGKEDIWHTIGGLRWIDQAPDDSDIITVAETDYNLTRVPDMWVDFSKEVDEVWVPNEWVYSAFEEVGYTDNIEIMPYGVDFSYRPTAYDCANCPSGMHTKPRGGGQCLADDTFTFLCVGRWYHIKGVDVLLEAFLREFSGDENVRLFLKTTSNNKFDLDGGGVAHAVDNLTNELGLTDPPEVGIRTDMMGDQELMDLYGVADAFAFPSRAECVGIAWVQAMHAGLPAVITDWSAMNEYISDGEALLIQEGEEVEPHSRVDWVPRKGGKWFPDGAVWFEPDIQDVQDNLRKMYEMDDEERQEIAARGQDMVHETFDWSKHIDARVNRFKELVQAQ